MKLYLVTLFPSYFLLRVYLIYKTGLYARNLIGLNFILLTFGKNDLIWTHHVGLSKLDQQQVRLKCTKCTYLLALLSHIINPDKIFLQNHVTQIFISVSYLESNLESIVSNLPIRMLPESHYLHSGYFGPVRRSWQSDGRDEVSKSEASTFLFVESP